MIHYCIVSSYKQVQIKVELKLQLAGWQMQIPTILHYHIEIRGQDVNFQSPHYYRWFIHRFEEIIN